MDRFSEDRFHDENAARAFLEGVLWPDGPICPHCGIINHAYPSKRPGVYRCAEPACRQDFTVTMNTVMERSHIALHKWLQAFHLMCSSKKGISAHQLHRTLDIGYKAAWFMCHRIREAMRMVAALDRSAVKARSSKQTKPITARSRKPKLAPRRQADGHSSKAARRSREQAPNRRLGRARRQCAHIPRSGRRSGHDREDRRREHRS